MLQHSTSTKNIMAALGRVQEEVDSVTKNSTNPHFRNTYVDLNGFLHALRGPLLQQGVVMVQSPGMKDSHVTVETLLTHLESGEYVMSTSSAPLTKNDPQGVGSAITYLRRYSLAALFAVPQEDDDGNAASSTSRTTSSVSSDGPPCVHEGCSGTMWDNRHNKKNPKSPDMKCKVNPDHVVWEWNKVEQWLSTALADLDGDVATRLKGALESGDIVALCKAYNFLRAA